MGRWSAERVGMDRPGARPGSGSVVLPPVHAAVPWLVSRLAAIRSVERVVLFGSRARGDHGPRSDVDLAVEVRWATLADRVLMAELVEDAPTLLGVDLVRLDAVDEGLRAAIAREGIVPYERDEAGAGDRKGARPLPPQA